MRDGVEVSSCNSPLSCPLRRWPVHTECVYVMLCILPNICKWCHAICICLHISSFTIGLRSLHVYMCSFNLFSVSYTVLFLTCIRIYYFSCYYTISLALIFLYETRCSNELYCPFILGAYLKVCIFIIVYIPINMELPSWRCYTHVSVINIIKVFPNVFENIFLSAVYGCFHCSRSLSKFSIVTIINFCKFDE